MDLRYLKKIVRLLEQSGVDEIEVEEEGTKIRVSRNGQKAGLPVAMPAAQSVVQAEPGSVTKGEEKPAAAKYHEVKSPIVGTFYRAPAPDADPYVEPGQTIQAGTVLCIIEAMKLMNEIESDVAGKVIKCLVENGQPVEYNQPLFQIEPA
jgi:acetyl-CoA carboxylase biotin carboxyl carrier protein